MRPKVLVDCDMQKDEDDWQRFAACVEPVALPGDGPCDAAALVTALKGVKGLIKLGRRLPDLSAEFLAKAPDLELIGVRGDRFGHGIDLAAAHALGIRCVDTDNIASSQPVAEWDLALILVCLRNGGAVYRQMMQGEEQWADAGNAEYVSGELTGKRVGLIGLGHVGQRLVELLEPFRVDLRVCDPYADAAVVRRLGVSRGTLDEVLAHAQILVVQVPHTPKTAGLIDARAFDLLGRGKIFINCSRGKVVDHSELVKRLERGDLIAGLDVFDPEPLPKDSPLRQLPNAFITPHIAWYAPHAMGRYFGSMADEFVRYFSGEGLRYELTQRMVDIRAGQEPK